ncbi:MAG: protein tyrosine phosphatase family protein [Oscillatoriales cyanobacterium C42_A2020_001]|nr:protein tyrosine phosphatase family protein [Leptolyngbyaceae cyanobacterium C42_A2020_001]
MNEAALKGIYNFLPISEAIATSGQPTEMQFEAIRDAEYDVVINLALPTSSNALPNERELVEQLGMKYVHIPVEWEQPTLEDAEQFFVAMQNYSEQKVFVHCAANMRVSAFMFLYRTLYQKVELTAAEQSLHQIWTPNPTWQQFMNEVVQSHTKLK